MLAHAVAVKLAKSLCEYKSLMLHFVFAAANEHAVPKVARPALDVPTPRKRIIDDISMTSLK
jgi:hypothetical protein